MLCMFVTVEVQDGKQKEFESILVELQAAVRKNEPGNVFYQLARDDKSPTTYHLLEAYTDEAALEVHFTTEYFKAAMPKVRECYAGAPKGKRMEGVV